jgi:2-polyprenyl-3-methyl-5-hydroxy-6-metoxy-1,4-benzoquinol methylase
MLTLMMRRYSVRRETCLDFGGGSGVFLPTLASGFRNVHLIDRNTTQAEELRLVLQIENANVVAADIDHAQLPERSFDAIVAADVLEHFRDLSVPVARLREWLRTDGHLYTSLPTENLPYRLLRVVFGKRKPPDHYHSARQVEQFLQAQGFRKVGGICHPLLAPVLPLYRISVWAPPAIP